MLLNYLKVTLRTLLKNKGYSAINILGLAIGLACFSLIYVYIQNETGYESFNPNAPRVCRVIGILNEPGLGEYHNAVTQALLGPAIQETFPQVETACRVMGGGALYMSRDDHGFYQEGIVFADPGVIDVLGIELLGGDKASALNEPRSIILDQETAGKLFGSESPLGRQIMVTGQEEPHPYRVTGVMKNFPRNSHVGFSAIVSIVTAEPRLPYMHNWNTNCLATYLLLKPGADRETLGRQITQLVKERRKQENGETVYYLQPLTDVHLKSGHILYQMNRNAGSANMLRMFIAIGIFVLLIASINYMNLATARSVQRAKEVGVRKVLGSGRHDLVSRFVGESTVTAVVAFLCSLVLVEVAYPWFTSVMGTRLVIDIHHSPAYLLSLGAIALVVGAASGIYPAFVLSSYQPADTLRGRFSKGRGGAFLRKILVLVQFSIAIILLACTWIVKDQMDFVRTRDIGFDKSQLMYVALPNRAAREKYLTMKDELERNTSVTSVSAGEGMAGAGGSDGTQIVAGTNKQVQLMMRWSPIDYDFFKTMGLKIVQGRDFSRQIASDSANGIIINEEAARQLGWTDAVGKQFEQDSTSRLTVIGVVNDYHYFSLYTKLEPQMLYISRNALRYMIVRLAAGRAEKGIDDVKHVWQQHLPAEPFNFGFVDEAFDRQYRADQNTQRLFIGFSVVAVLVGCLGLFGLSAFTAEQRTKEIGIRKTLGASTSSLVFRLSTEFVKLVGFSCLLAFPVAWWAMQEWLQTFAYRTAVSPWSFLAAGGLVVLIAFVTVSAQSMKVALANPVQSLRYE